MLVKVSSSHSFPLKVNRVKIYFYPNRPGVHMSTSFQWIQITFSQYIQTFMSSTYIIFGNGRWNKLCVIYRESRWKWIFNDFLAEVSKTWNHIQMKASIPKMKKKKTWAYWQSAVNYQKLPQSDEKWRSYDRVWKISKIIFLAI